MSGIFKRCFDVFFSLLGLIVLSPLFLITALVIVLDSPGGVFFRGTRVGLHNKDFKIFKFRSMIVDAEGNGKWNVGDDDDRITRVGHILRKTKLDEIPQLINILIGDMSFVGPRPELRYYVDMYSEEETAILDLKPGLTDWASMVNFEQFKSFTSSDDPDECYLKEIRPLKIRLQLYYRYNHGFFSDIKCIFWTAYKVLFRSERLPKNIQNIVHEFKNKPEVVVFDSAAADMESTLTGVR